MKSTQLLYLVIVLFCTNTALTAQVGKYIYEDDEAVETLEIRQDGTFEYINKTTWAKSVTQGTWKPEGGKVLLHSQYQQSDYIVLEGKDDVTAKGKMRVVVEGEAKGNAPNDIKAVYLIGKDTTKCEQDYEKAMAAYEARQKLQIGGTAAEKDSLNNTDLQQFYSCNGAETVTAVQIDLGDDVLLTHEITDAGSNQLVFRTRFAPLDTYRYFADEAFVIEKKHIKEAKTGKLYKFTKK